MAAIQTVVGAVGDRTNLCRLRKHALRTAVPRNTRCKAGDNHVRPIINAAFAEQPADVAWNAYDGAAAAHAETARWSLESAEFWASDAEEAEAGAPVQQEQEPSGSCLHLWSYKYSAVMDAETSRNSLDSMDVFLD